MINAKINTFLQGYTIRAHGDTGILIAEKKIFLPEREFIMQTQCQDMVYRNSNNIIIVDSDFTLKGGKSL